MKKISFVITAVVFFISFFSTNLIAQPAPGDQGSGGAVLEPAPVSFKRDNGNGTCPAQSEIRVAFDVLPQHLPTIAQVRSEQRDVAGIVIGYVDATPFPQKGYVSYCISSKDILPATKLWIRFHYEKSNQDVWLTENERDNKAIYPRTK